MRERPNLIVRPTECKWLEEGEVAPKEEVAKIEEPVKEPIKELPKELTEELQEELDYIKAPPAKYRIELRISDSLGQQSNLQATLQRHIDDELNKFFSASSDIIINMPNGDSILLKNTEAIVSSDNFGNRTAEYKPKKENIVISNHHRSYNINISTPMGSPSHYIPQHLLQQEQLDWDQVKAQREREVERFKLIKSGLLNKIFCEGDFEKK